MHAKTSNRKRIILSVQAGGMHARITWWSSHTQCMGRCLVALWCTVAPRAHVSPLPANANVMLMPLIRIMLWRKHVTHPGSGGRVSTVESPSPAWRASTIPSNTAESISTRKISGSNVGSIVRRYCSRNGGVRHRRRHVRMKAFAESGGVKGSIVAVLTVVDGPPPSARPSRYLGMTKPSKGFEIAADCWEHGLTGRRCAPATILQKSS